MLRRSHSAALCMAFLLAACNGGAGKGEAGSPVCKWPPVPTEAQIGAPLGYVDGMPFGTLEFDTMAAREMGRDGTIGEESRKTIVDALVEEKLLYMEALRQGIDKDPKIQKMMVNTLLKQEVYGQVRTSEITEDELRAYFADHEDEFVVAAKFQIKRILVKPEEGESAEAARARAEEIRAAVLSNPADFKSLAQRHSKDPYARRGGDLGFVTKEGKPGVDPAVVEAAFALPAGQDVSDVFETAEGLNIVYVPNRRERVERPFEAMRGSVLRKVKSDKYKALYDGYVDGLRAKAKIEVDDQQVAAHEIRSARPLDIDASGLRRPRDPSSFGPGPLPEDGSPMDDAAIQPLDEAHPEHAVPPMEPPVELPKSPVDADQ